MQRNCEKYNLFEIIFLITVMIYILGAFLAYKMPGESWRSITTKTGYGVDLLYCTSLFYAFYNWNYLNKLDKLKIIIGEFFILLGYFYYHFYGKHPYISAINNITFDFATAVICLSINSLIRKVRNLKLREKILVSLLNVEQKSYFVTTCKNLRV